MSLFDFKEEKKNKNLATKEGKICSNLEIPFLIDF
jgi:hypothetical protein